MFSKEDFDSWNEFFPDGKIKQTDLANPTETFLTKTLILYLQKFGYDINPSMQYPQKGNETDNLRERRLFLIKLAKHIDHILKITDKAYIFTYYDLIHPTPKKTSHMLGILLNHLCYYNLYKTEVFSKAGAAMQTHDELIKRVQEIEQENIARKLKAEKIKEEITQLSEQLPEAQAKFAALNAAKLKQREDIQQIEETFKDMKTKLDDLNLQKRNLKKKLVPDHEVKELQTQLENLQLKIEEQNEEETTTKNSLNESTDNLINLQNLLKQIAETQELLPLSQLATLKNIDKQLKDTKLKANVIQQTKQSLTLQVEIQQSEIKTLDEKITALKNKYGNEKSEIVQKINAMQSSCDQIEKKLDIQRGELHTFDCLFKEQEGLKCFLHENVRILINAYLPDIL